VTLQQYTDNVAGFSEFITINTGGAACSQRRKWSISGCCSR